MLYAQFYRYFLMRESGVGKNLSSFAEIYIESPLEELLKRDSRGIYSNKKVAGISLDFPIPENPEMKISNSKDLSYLLSYTQTNS